MMDLYDLNDALEDIAQQSGITWGAFNSEERYDEWLNEFTHTAASWLDAARQGFTSPQA